MSAPAATGLRPHIVVLGDAEQALRRLGDWSAIDAVADVTVHSQPLQGAPLVEALRAADVVVLVRDRTPFSAELLAQLPRLRYLVFTGTRNTTLDQDAVAARGIPVDHTQWGPSKDSTCEMTWALILAAKRQIEQQTALLRSGQWRSAQAQPLAGVLHGETLGLVGLGEIGSRVAKVGLALGMNVVTWSPNMTAERAAAHGVQSVSLAQLLATSAVMSLHLVPSAATRQLINAERLATMRPDGLLVNTSRSALIDTNALVDARPLPRWTCSIPSRCRTTRPCATCPMCCSHRTWALSPSRCLRSSPTAWCSICTRGCVHRATWRLRTECLTATAGRLAALWL